MVLFITLLCLATCCLLAAWWKHRVRLSHATRNIPKIGKQLPILGIAHQIACSSSKLWTFLKNVSTETNDKGGITTAWFGPTMLNVFVTDPNLSVALSNACLQKVFFYDWVRDTLGEGLSTSHVNIWKTHRKILNPAFNQNVLNSFLQIFNRQSSKLVMDFSQYVGSGEFNPRACVANKSLETICQTAMGLPEYDLDVADETYQKSVNTLINLLSNRIRSPWMYSQTIYNLTSLKRKEDWCNKIVHEKTRNVLEKSKKETNQMLDNTESPNLKNRLKSFMGLLLQKSDIGQLSDKEINDEVTTMILVGHETTANSLVHILIIIGSLNQVQERIYNELHDIFGQTDRDVTKEDLTKLVYLEAVIKECLRLYPTVPFMARTVEKDVQIGDITLPTGSDIFFSIWGINRHPCWGADRNEFNPDRWLSPDTLPSNPNAFAAFAMGKRNCIGKIYAMMSLKVSLVHILRKYQVKEGSTKLKFGFNFTLNPISGETISVEPR